jgi:hypothetical protein
MATRSEGMDMWMSLKGGLSKNLMDLFVDTIEKCPDGMTIGQHLANILRKEADRLEGKTNAMV